MEEYEITYSSNKNFQQTEDLIKNQDHHNAVEKKIQFENDKLGILINKTRYYDIIAMMIKKQN